MGFSCGSADKESACNAGDLGLIPGLGRSPGEGKGYPLQYSCLENSMDYMGVSRVRLMKRTFHGLSPLTQHNVSRTAGPEDKLPSTQGHTGGSGCPGRVGCNHETLTDAW